LNKSRWKRLDRRSIISCLHEKGYILNSPFHAHFLAGSVWGKMISIGLIFGVARDNVKKKD